MSDSQYTSEDQVIANINIIPFVDIILVLLIIFMVTTPYLVKMGFSLKLANAPAADKLQSSNVQITIRANGAIFLNKKPIELSRLTTDLKQSSISPDTPVILAADKNILHGKVIKVINAIKSAGLKIIAISTSAAPPPIK